MLNVASKLSSGTVFPTEPLALYLDLKSGPTNSLVYADVEKQSDIDEVLYKIIEVVYSVLGKCDFKVGQLNKFGEYLVKCSSAADVDKLHHIVKVCMRTVIGFRKMGHVFIANPDEYVLHRALKYELKKAKDKIEVSGSKKRKM